ncbi:hypothetical protein LMG23994_01720 [Cupriavidus pinatubonensis]|uniref:Uncharacterized protein n=1 Tax=Cupriavidus pinatubonensis TaxID=248026 RepID=A0ABM8WR16_9BURK|nr:hypothetical protein LMG23994_01720 [Cupriavidus pinatubonensis]
MTVLQIEPPVLMLPPRSGMSFSFDLGTLRRLISEKAVLRDIWATGHPGGWISPQFTGRVKAPRAMDLMTLTVSPSVVSAAVSRLCEQHRRAREKRAR